MDVKDQIRARLPIEQLVAQYCQLKKKGRSYVCLCPFHSDKNPSFLVSPDKGIAYCFACQSGGDIFSFYQKIESVDFPTAVRQLAEKAGVELPKDRPSLAPSVSKDEKERVKECLAAAAAWYRTSLASHADASAYVAARGVPAELLERFQIGYAPDSFSATYDHLLKQGFSRTEIVAAGLGVQKELQDQRIYDRFRHRIMFPITDAQGAVIGFGGRALGESDAKYVNSPEGIVYHKSSVLFGLSLARDAIRQARSVVLVEGYFDVVAAHRAGVHNVVAVSGTALTHDHVKILRRYAETVVLCLDQDNAGQLAASRAFGLLAEEQFDIRSVTLPAKDPDELVQRDPAAFASIIHSGGEPFLPALLHRLCRSHNVRDPGERRRIVDVVFPLFAHLKSSVELRACMQLSATLLGAVQSDIERDFSAWTRSSVPDSSRRSAPPTLSSPTYTSAELCLGIACVYPATRPCLVELLSLPDRSTEALRTALAGADATVAFSAIVDTLDLDAVTKERFRVLALYAEEHFQDWSDSVADRECRRMIAIANRDLTVRRQMEIADRLREAQRTGRSDEEAALLHQYQQVLKLSRMASGT